MRDLSTALRNFTPALWPHVQFSSRKQCDLVADLAYTARVAFYIMKCAALRLGVLSGDARMC